MKSLAEDGWKGCNKEALEDGGRDEQRIDNAKSYDSRTKLKLRAFT